jgi:hypothetical protein
VLEISRFFGIVVAMFYNDHPPPHFHVRYGSQRASVDSSTLAVLEGCRRARLAWWWSGRRGTSRTSRHLGPCAPPCATEPDPAF